MKRLLYCAAALATLLFASCQQENLEPVGGGTAVTYTVEAPGALQTKAIADGTNVDELIYEDVDNGLLERCCEVCLVLLHEVGVLLYSVAQRVEE